MIQAYAVASLLVGLVYLAVVATLTIVVAVRAQGRPRTFGMAGFGLLTLNQLVQLVAPVMIGVLVESTDSGPLGRGGVQMLYLVPTTLGVVVSVVALWLIAMAVIGVRAGSGPSDPSAPLR